ncbi:unnamed protein product, partial [Closterium sp. NIES-54]
MAVNVNSPCSHFSLPALPFSSLSSSTTPLSPAFSPPQPSQREIAAYMAVNVNSPFSHFSLDDHFNRVFKEGWANAQFPGHLPSRGYQMQDIQAVFRVRRQQHRRKGEKRFEANRAALLQQADAIGRLVQYNTTGFL